MSDFPKVTQLMSKVVWRPRKAKSGKHSLHFIVRRPFDDSIELCGWKVDYSRLKVDEDIGND